MPKTLFRGPKKHQIVCKKQMFDLVTSNSDTLIHSVVTLFIQCIQNMKKSEHFLCSPTQLYVPGNYETNTRLRINMESDIYWTPDVTFAT